MDSDAPSSREAVRYPARFVDRFGESEASFQSDGRCIAVSFRGLTFSTGGESNLEWLALEGDPVDVESKAVVSSEGELREGTIEVGLPVDAVSGANVRSAVLLTGITFTGDDSQFVFSLLLNLEGELIGPAVAGAEFEMALDRLRAMLPAGVRLRMCGTCLLSSNGIYRNYASGRSCYRSTPAEALTARWTGHPKQGWPPPTEDVADFHVCPQWIPSEVRTWLKAFGDPRL